MAIDTKRVLVDFEGKPLKTEDNKELTVGMAVSNIIMSSGVKDPLKLYILGQKFRQEGNVELDTADLEFVKEHVKDNKYYISAIVPGQILEILSKN
jgi:hypothetical protein